MKTQIVNGISISNTQDSKVGSNSKIKSFGKYLIHQTHLLKGGSIGENDTIIDIYVIKE